VLHKLREVEKDLEGLGDRPPPNPEGVTSRNQKIEDLQGNCRDDRNLSQNTKLPIVKKKKRL